MASAYPGGLDSFATNKADGTATPTDHPTHHNDLADAVNKIEAELGTNPSGAAATVAAAIAAASVPDFLMYPFARVAGETAHADDDFFATVTGYTETDVTGTTTWSATRGGLSCVFAGQSAQDFSILVKPIPAAGVPITIETKAVDVLNGDNNPMWGILFTDGTTSAANLAAFGKVSNGSGGVANWYQFTGTVGTVTATSLAKHLGADRGRPFIRLRWSAANTFQWSLSPDTENWTDLGQADLSTTFTPTHMGFFVSAWGAAETHIVSFHYLRVYEA